MRVPGILIVLISVSLTSISQPATRKNSSSPALVVGLVVDQMRWDYLYRFQDRYSAGGFNRILNEGFSCENTYIPYTPTYTAAGHACVYTGSVPAIHGIMGNSWYSRELKRNVYCTEDSTVKTVGSSSDAGMMSPRNMLSTSITDELRLSTNFRSKVIAFAIKDRGSILPAGHSANGAYWFDDATGGWITSDYYMQDLPDWVKSLNAKKLPDNYMKKDWNTLYPVNTYIQSSADDKPYENNIPDEDNTFPHTLSKITKNKYGAFKTTPYGNTYTFDAGKAAVESEKLGMRGVTDFLALSLSSPDYIGHSFGPNSIEVEDMYLRLDRDLEEFLNFLDRKIGKGKYIFFLSADHAVAHTPGFMQENRIPAGVASDSQIKKDLIQLLKENHGLNDVISEVTNYQVYLNNENIKTAAEKENISSEIIRLLLKRPEIANAFKLDAGVYPVQETFQHRIKNGYNQKLSGDIQYSLLPGYFSGGSKGTTHGSWYPYDSHIPLVWYGWNIKKGKTNRDTYMTDIAPTIAAMLNIQMPNGSVGNAIEEVWK